MLQHAKTSSCHQIWGCFGKVYCYAEKQMCLQQSLCNALFLACSKAMKGFCEIVGYWRELELRNKLIKHRPPHRTARRSVCMQRTYRARTTARAPFNMSFGACLQQKNWPRICPFRRKSRRKTIVSRSPCHVTRPPNPFPPLALFPSRPHEKRDGG